MRAIIFTLFFAFTANAMPQHWVTWPMNGTIYLKKELCPSTCYPFIVNDQPLDLEIVNLVNGVLVEDPDKKILKQQAQAAAAAQAKSDQDSINAIADKLANGGKLNQQENDVLLKQLAQKLKK